MTLAEKLLEVQKEIKPIEKDSVNPHFKNKYFDINTLLADIKPILNKYGLVVSQPLTNIDGVMAIQTTLMDSENPKDNITHITPLPVCADAQKYGSAISYFRRYAIVCLLAIEGEQDDDGNVSAVKNIAQFKSGEPIIQTDDNFGI